ncbi:hypothetical protein IAT38_001081 [Cryptococcus sp. DSM 104549]
MRARRAARNVRYLGAGLVLSQILLAESAMGISIEKRGTSIANGNVPRAPQESQSGEAASGFISVGVLAVATDETTAADPATTTATSDVSLAADPTQTVEQATSTTLSTTNSILPTTATTDSVDPGVPTTTATATQTASAAGDEGDATASLPPLTTGADGTLQWQPQVVAANDNPETSSGLASAAVTTSSMRVSLTQDEETATATAVGDDAAVTSTTDNHPLSNVITTSVAVPTQLITQTASRGVRTTVVVAVTDPGSGEESSATTVSDVTLANDPTGINSDTAEATATASGPAFSADAFSATSSVRSSLVASGTSTRSGSGSFSTTSKAAALNFEDVTASSRATSASETASATGSGRGDDGVVAVEESSKSSTESLADQTLDMSNGSASKSATATNDALSGPTTTAASGSSDLAAGSASATGDAAAAATTYVSNGVTLTGQDAVAALAAQQTGTETGSGSTKASAEATGTSEEGKSKLSSIAIVGIVGGVLVGVILLYLVWYQWRKKRARKSLGEEIPDGDDDEDNEKPHRSRSRDSYDDNRLTRSSFGAAEPVTPAGYRRRRDRDTYLSDGGRDDYGATYYDDGRTYYDDGRMTMAPTEYDDMGYEYGDGRTVAGEPMTAGPGQDGRTEYALTQYGDGMTAALADGMVTGAPTTMGGSKAGGGENPFAPIPPVPRMPSAHANTKGTTVRASSYGAPPAPNMADPNAEYGTSIYDAYGGPDSRPQTQFTEPSTSGLLPWLNKGAQTPAPSVPPVNQQYLPPQSQNQGQSQAAPPHPAEPPRAPPRAVMAQTPMPMGMPMAYDGGLEAAPIPAFR